MVSKKLQPIERVWFWLGARRSKATDSDVVEELPVGELVTTSEPISTNFNHLLENL